MKNIPMNHTPKNSFLAEAPRGERSLPQLRQDALAGDAEAQYRLYQLYMEQAEQGDLHPEAPLWLAKSAEQGYPEALYTIAQQQIAEVQTGAIPPQALFYLEIAGDRGYTEAYLRLYELYLKGKGVTEDHERAKSFLTKAMEQGSSRAFFIVAQSLLPQGGSNSVDYDSSYYYAEQAAQRGSKEAIPLIIELLEGNFVEGDHTELLGYWRRQLKAC